MNGLLSETTEDGGSLCSRPAQGHDLCEHFCIRNTERAYPVCQQVKEN